MKPTYFLVYEETDECDWQLYNFSSVETGECHVLGFFALVQFKDPDFHEAHLCGYHGAIVLGTLEKLYGNGGQVNDEF